MDKEEEKLQSVTFEYETYTAKLSGEHAQAWIKWVNGVLAFDQLRTGSKPPAGIHDHWEKKTKKQIRKEKIDKLNNKKQ